MKQIIDEQLMVTYEQQEVITINMAITPHWLEAYKVLSASQKFSSKYFATEKETFERLSRKQNQANQLFMVKFKNVTE